MGVSQETKSDLMDFPQTCTYLNIKSCTLRSWVFYGKVPVIRLGGILRFSKTDINYWINEKRKAGLPGKTSVAAKDSKKKAHYKTRYGELQNVAALKNKLHKEILCQEKRRRKKQ